ncbi:hypothetical protein Q0590_28260 [Rhodocytophaga aerolata]|uniref:Uncharacterized protein n=1 Tax=Rhodocytophaga aerolata TaxID=455078 RepID=A0ABT8RHN0_9BACT|nr:hypothetical protein [Rhodocytophaga aerolata]MDO1450207.1 hypothetical protein [Rhodocytophaga aerolata]
MNDIIVKKVMSSDYGFLIPRYDKESGILEITSRKSKEWIYGIDIDGVIIFDIDEDLIIENLDVCVDKKYWKKVDNFPDWNLIEDKIYNLKVDASSIKIKSFNYGDIKLFTDKRSESLMITFNLSSQNEILKMYKVSNHCFCFINEDILQGFFINLKKG